MANANEATYLLNGTSVTARDGENMGGVVTPDWDGGGNRAGSNAPGIGIATGTVQAGDHKTDDWTLLDQREVARDPQDSQHLGGDGLDDGTSGVTTQTPINVYDEVGGDYNDTAVLADLAVGWVRTTVA